MIVRLLLFAGAREAAGCGKAELEVDEGATLNVLLTDAVERFGDPFARVLATARVWVNGEEPAGAGAVLHAGDEIAVLPPVSGGAGGGGGVPGRSSAPLLPFAGWCASTSVPRSYGASPSPPPQSRC